MAVKYLILWVSLFIIGCSSSDDDNGQSVNDPSDLNGESAIDTSDLLGDGNTTDLPGDNQAIAFSDPDTESDSEVAQLSYPVVLELSRELVTGAYLDQYFAIDSSVGLLLVDGIGGQDAFQEGQIPEGEVQAPFACPEGGSVSVSYTDRNGPAGVFTGVFADCMVDGYTLAGTLTRDQSSGVTGGGSFIDVGVDFDGLVVNDDTDGVLTLNGSVSRNSSTSTAEMVAPGERGSCVLESSNITLGEFSNMQSAVWEMPGIAGNVTVTSSSYERSESRRYDASSDQASCPLNQEVREEGNAAFTFNTYGPAALDGTGTVTTTVATDVVADIRTHNATQQTVLPEGSTVTVTATSDSDCTAQIDILSDGAALSFVGDFCFDIEDF